jgi:hypothetical protein
MFFVIVGKAVPTTAGVGLSLGLRGRGGRCRD